MIEYLDRIFFETGVIRAVQQFVGTGIPRPFEILSLLGDTWGLILAIGVTLWLFGRDETYAVIGIIALGAVVKEAISLIFKVPRPSGPEIVAYEHLEVSSFPSGHVLHGFIPWGILYADRRISIVIPVLIVLLLSVSRLYLGVHFLGDIVFAIIVGILLIWIYRYLWSYAKPWLSKRSLWFYGFLGLVASGGVLANIIFKLNNPRRWEILGLILGTTIGLILERSYLKTRLKSDSWRRKFLVVFVGIIGIVAFWIVDRLGNPDALVLGLFTTAGAAVWATFLVPLIFYGRENLPK